MTHQHAWPGDLDCKALADDVCITKAQGAYIIAFDVESEDRRVVGSVPIGPDGWSESGSWEDGTLTLSPSVDWNSPPRPRRHGWVRDGKWVGA